MNKIVFDLETARNREDGSVIENSGTVECELSEDTDGNLRVTKNWIDGGLINSSSFELSRSECIKFAKLILHMTGS